VPGRAFLGGGFDVVAPAPEAPTVGIGRTNPINNWTDAVGHASLKAMDPETGEAVWEFDQFDVSDSGMLTTATDLLFTGGREGHFHALDATNGELLWKTSLGGQIVMAPVTFAVDGVQYISVISGHVLATFALEQ
jgi:alcohol dehydrogenase (cytochrome c)